MTVAARPWVEVGLQSLGTFVHVLVTEEDLLAEAEALVVRELEALDLACSRFRPDSELMMLVPGRPTQIGPVLAAVVAAALETAQITDGLVDPTLAEALRAIGYDRTFAQLPLDGPAALPLAAQPDRWRRLRLELTETGTLLTVPVGLGLDLGASAKAWAADQIARRVSALGTGVLVNLGGDLATAGEPPDGGWPVQVCDRREHGVRVQTIAISGGALATSSTTARTWRRGGVTMHHILDPATGLPAVSPWRSVSVCAPTCLEANALSTAAIVLGVAAPEWLVASGRPACLLGEDGVVLRLNDWPEAGPS